MMGKSCFICGNSTDALVSYECRGEITHLCESRIHCEGTMNAKRVTAHFLRTGVRGHVIPAQTATQPDRRTLSAGDD